MDCDHRQLEGGGITLHGKGTSNWRYVYKVEYRMSVHDHCISSAVHFFKFSCKLYYQTSCGGISIISSDGASFCVRFIS